jgi:hypothetical protein
LFGKNIYKVKHLPTQQEIYVSNGDIKRWLTLKNG